jgi:hypothetical protein
MLHTRKPVVAVAQAFVVLAIAAIRSGAMPSSMGTKDSHARHTPS